MKKVIYIQKCKSTSVNGKITDAQCSVNGKKLSKKESIDLINTNIEED